MPRALPARVLLVAVALAVASALPAQEPLPQPAPTPPSEPSPTPPTSGFAEAPERASDPQQRDFIAPPENFIVDPGYLLDPPRRVKLEAHLEGHRRETGIRVYLAAYPSLRDESPSTRAVRLQSGWVQNGLGGVLVYGADTRRFGVAVSRATSETLPPGSLQGVLERSERNLKSSKNVALVLREATMDLEYELRSALRENQRKRNRTAPLRIAVIVVLAAGFLVGITFLIHQLRVQNLFGRSHRFVRRPDPPSRYGGLRSGGICAVIRFGEKTEG